MRNIKLTIRYDGTAYVGWQRQKNGVSVQEAVEKTLRKIIGEKICLIGAGRTDSGVHARGQVANFKTASHLAPERIKRALNSRLPEDIAVSAVEEAGTDFHAQFSALGKRYRYTILNSDAKDPFVRRFAYYCPQSLDLSEMRKAARHLVGKHDLKALQNSGSVRKDTVRMIRKIAIEKNGPLVYIDIEAAGFLYNMARNIVGTLIEVGRGKMPAVRVKEILSGKDRRYCGPTAPARGLCLIKVIY
ncbi:MAG: tRNA pseudouridine(38-40) synthase TruA [Candidatus Omnitrophica bacterium]|nr:tRNA pseudouridine(38-40) synthase TruA [Candidatus Omnitrophota bacterium]